MKIMNCPLNGPRNISEFICAGDVVEEPDPNRCSDEEWAHYVFLHDNAAGVVQEWWCHVPTAFWFIAERQYGDGRDHPHVPGHRFVPPSAKTIRSRKAWMQHHE